MFSKFATFYRPRLVFPAFVGFSRFSENLAERRKHKEHRKPRKPRKPKNAEKPKNLENLKTQQNLENKNLEKPGGGLQKPRKAW